MSPQAKKLRRFFSDNKERGKPLELLFLGTGAGIPSKSRNVSALALKLLDELNEIWLFDCGEATQHQILETTIRPRKIRRIFITHLHGDHIFGLPGLLSSRSFQMSDVDPLTIYGPKGIASFVQQSLKFSKTKLQYPLEIIELDDKGGELTLHQNWKVKYLPLNHGTLCFGFRIEEPDHPGELLMDRVMQYDVPHGPLLGQLKAGKTIELPSGVVLDGKYFVGKDKPGRILTILGDTRSHEHIHTLALGVDVLVHEATHDGSESKMAHQYYHSTNEQAASAAKKAGVGKLLMNHISARYLYNDVQQLQQKAQKIFSQSYIVKDFDEITIPMKIGD